MTCVIWVWTIIFSDAKDAKETLERVIQAMIRDSIKEDKISYRGLILTELYEKDKEFEKAEKLYLDLLRLPSIPQERKTIIKTYTSSIKRKVIKKKLTKPLRII